MHLIKMLMWEHGFSCAVAGLGSGTSAACWLELWFSGTWRCSASRPAGHPGCLQGGRLSWLGLEEEEEEEEASKQSPAVPPTFFGVSPPSLLPSSLPPRDRSSSSRFESCGKEVAAIMIPEEIQRLLEGNHEFLLAPFLLNGGNLLWLQGKELKSFLHLAVLSQREEWKGCRSYFFSKADGFGVLRLCMPSLSLTPMRV